MVTELLPAVFGIPVCKEHCVLVKANDSIWSCMKKYGEWLLLWVISLKQADARKALCSLAIALVAGGMPWSPVVCMEGPGMSANSRETPA